VAFDFEESKGDIDQLKADVADLKQEVEQVYGELFGVSAFVACLMAEFFGKTRALFLVETSVNLSRGVDTNLGGERFKRRLLTDLENYRPE